MSNKGHTLFQRFYRDQQGVAAIELAIILPAILTLFLGVVEISNFILVNQRAEKMSHIIADLITQEETITDRQITTIMNAAKEIMQPFPFDAAGKVVITSIHRDPEDEAEVAWQRESTGTLSDSESRFGLSGQDADLPASFDLNERETVIVAEIFYDYAPFITNIFTSSTRIYKYAFYKPRLGALDTVASQ